MLSYTSSVGDCNGCRRFEHPRVCTLWRMFVVSERDRLLVSVLCWFLSIFCDIVLRFLILRLSQMVNSLRHRSMN